MTNPTIPDTPPLCACGCGQRVLRRKGRATERWNYFVKGHQQRVCQPQGETHPNFKGGLNSDGSYVLVLRHGHPRADRRGYVKRSILVAEEKYGRPVRRGECVHHINGVKTDDRPDNLEVMTISAHVKHHNVIGALNADPVMREKVSGEHHWNAKLDWPAVRHIRSLLGTKTQRALAVQFGVSYSTISQISRGVIWRDDGHFATSPTQTFDRANAPDSSAGDS
jgi:hypothetical protein